MNGSDRSTLMYRIGQPGETMILAYQLLPALHTLPYPVTLLALATPLLHDALNTSRHCTIIQPQFRFPFPQRKEAEYIG